MRTWISEPESWHLPAMEAPELLHADIRGFFTRLAG
jgi:hypothetical protein